jgi:subtilisin family serine protease
MIDSVNDGANIVSMSLGSDTGFERADPYGQVITNAKNNGVTFVVAAGNSGHNGPILSSSPAVAIDAVAVASVDSARYPTTYKVKSNRGGEWRYSSLWPVMGEFNVFAAPDYDESLGCDFESLQKAIEKVEEYGWDITKTFYMVRQNERCSLDGAVLNSYYYGFKAVIAWRDHEFPNPYDNDYVGSAPPLFTLSIDHIDGPKLYDAIKVDPRNFRLRFTDQRFLAVDNPSAGLTSNYSSLGNTWEYNAFKPLISAPGHLILSSWPLEAGGYTIISGTSMGT